MNKPLLANTALVWLGGLAGLIPFYFSALALQLGWFDVVMFQFYSVIILSFLSGVIWWAGIQHSDRASILLALVVPALAWLALLLPVTLLLFVLATAYGVLWVWEILRLRGLYPASYMLLRTLLTCFVLLAHAWVLWL